MTILPSTAVKLSPAELSSMAQTHRYVLVPLSMSSSPADIKQACTFYGQFS